MRLINRVKNILTKEYLETNYISLNKSIYDISRETGFYKATISKYLDMYNISKRSLSESKLGYKRSEISKVKQSNTLKNKPFHSNLVFGSGQNNANYKHGKYFNNLCECGKEMSPKATTCSDCYDKSGSNNPMFGKISKRKFNGGYYKDIWMRSSYEIFYAKYLDSINILWKYEPAKFNIVDSKGTEYTYSPDFYLPQTNEYIETKGYWFEKQKMKYDLFVDQYPKIKISVLYLKDLELLGYDAKANRKNFSIQQKELEKQIEGG